MFTPVEHEIRGWPGRIDDDRVVQLAAQTLQSFFAGGGRAREHAEYALADIDLRPPVLYPPAIRDFYAFEQHVLNARAVTGRGEVPPEWYEIPVFYFSNPAAIYGPEDEIPYPEGSEALDYELEVAAVIGADGEIGGFTIMNDWSARDLQRKEMRVGLGPAKGKDFATSLGPVVVTPDALQPGDEVELEVEGIGVLRNRIAARR
jgi:fumarylacetoacetate (FAA) hydrolase